MTTIDARRGFSVLEVTVASGMMAMLAVLMSSAWQGLGRPMLEAGAEYEIAQEAQRATAFLGASFGGQLGTIMAGTKKKGRKSGRMVVGTAELRFCFDGGTDPNGVADWASPDTVLVYSLSNGKLIRTNQESGSVITIARHVELFTVHAQGNDTVVELTFNCRNLQRTYKLIGKGL